MGLRAPCSDASRFRPASAPLPFIPACLSTHHHAQEVPALGAGDVCQGVVLDQGAGAAVQALEHGVNLGATQGVEGRVDVWGERGFLYSTS